MTPTRAAGFFAFFVVGVALALHGALLFAWHFSIAPELEAAPYPEQLETTVVEAFPQPGEDWPEIAVSGLSLRAPLAEPAHAIAERCAGRCQLALEGGKLTFFAESLVEPFEAKIRELTPTREEVRWFRSPLHNWRMIRSLAVRSSMPNPMPPTERYLAPRSRGIVTYFYSQGVGRWVVYAYAVTGDASQVLAVSGTSRDVFLAVLGSLAVGDAR